MKLSRDFFNRLSTEVARNLLGQVLVFGSSKWFITETESYRGADDPASHAFKGSTKRTQIMFGTPGFSYVYLIYGIHHCLNIVTEELGSPSAVLIRGLRSIEPSNILLDGPGKICRAMNITRQHNGIDLVTHKHFYIEEGQQLQDFVATPRIGITKGLDKLWRFVLKNQDS